MVGDDQACPQEGAITGLSTYICKSQTFVCYVDVHNSYILPLGNVQLVHLDGKESGERMSTDVQTGLLHLKTQSLTFS